MLVPVLGEHVSVKGNSEIFRVVAFSLNACTADLIRLGMGVIEHGVPWAMLEAVGDDRASWPGSPDEPANQGEFVLRPVFFVGLIS